MQKGASDIWLMAHGTEDFADMMTIDHTPSVLGGCLGGVLLQPAPKFCSGTPQSNKELTAYSLSHRMTETSPIVPSATGS
jgi:hypothetical protein